MCSEISKKGAKVTWSEVTFNANSVHFMLLPPFKHFNHLKNLSLKYMSSFPQSLSMSVDNVIKTCCYAELWLRPGKETESRLSNNWFIGSISFITLAYYALATESQVSVNSNYLPLPVLCMCATWDEGWFQGEGGKGGRAFEVFWRTEDITQEPNVL